jgi:hypothetical protein
MATISSLQIGGSTYDIYAKSATSALSATSATSAANADKAKSATSAGSAAKLTTPRTLTFAGHVAGSVSTDWGSNKTATLTVAASPWSSMAGVSAGSVTTTTTGFVTPKAVYDFVQTSTAAAITNAYVHKGTLHVSSLSSTNAKVGWVYNVSGCANTGTTINGQLVYNGDNMVATAAGAAVANWDKLAATFDASNYITTAQWNTATGTWNTTTTTVSNNSATNWANTAHKAFSTVKAGSITIAAGSNAANFTLSGLGGLAVSGSGTTATVYPTAYNYGKISIGGAVTQASSIGDTFGFAAGSNIELVNGTRQVSFSGKDTTYSEATTALLGTNKKSYVTGTTAVIF